MTEEIVVDGQLAERIKPDGVMLRHMLARADRRCDDDRLAARPVQQSERHFEALLDCIGPDAECAEAEAPGRAGLTEQLFEDDDEGGEADGGDKDREGKGEEDP
ncbi:hypothetical protein [Parasphingopyxis lamellibrachiae]|uniref:Uncharacterized protein n=1 Tax=Parasphingopyxis lamellibrachiae TaxID=680125 RepID=A0A3D9FGZ1_9SPHN|nr:hypothetical protein [Parasphingopyxis lamellibrachiae]RED16832.1 hypothetical protein DFR46_1864 [Parasphingopyxis lamellibrachiae]